MTDSEPILNGGQHDYRITFLSLPLRVIAVILNHNNTVLETFVMQHQFKYLSLFAFLWSIAVQSTIAVQSSLGTLAQYHIADN